MNKNTLIYEKKMNRREHEPAQTARWAKKGEHGRRKKGKKGKKPIDKKEKGCYTNMAQDETEIRLYEIMPEWRNWQTPGT